MQSTLLIAFSMLPCDLQMWMNVLEALIGVIGMQLVTTLKEVIPALATVDTEGMDFIAQVYMSIIIPSQEWRLIRLLSWLSYMCT